MWCQQMQLFLSLPASLEENLQFRPDPKATSYGIIGTRNDGTYRKLVILINVDALMFLLSVALCAAATHDLSVCMEFCRASDVSHIY